MIPKSGNLFRAFAKPAQIFYLRATVASAGEGGSEKSMLQKAAA